nr:transglycosylase domain-containing protein [Psychrobacter sp. PraFG1]UNK04794.1 transglycosylase domain-containing protein [Psychrobacter sp. PraFG1]
MTQTWVEYEDIAKSAKRAAIVSEDSRFASHNGFDMEGIEAAMKKMKAQAQWQLADQPSLSSLPKTYF